jgi:hypothetical protein
MENKFKEFIKIKKGTLVTIALLGFFYSTIFKVFRLTDTVSNHVIVIICNVILFIIIHYLLLKRLEK